MSEPVGNEAPRPQGQADTTPGEQRWKAMVARLAARTGMSPLDVEAATEVRVRASEVAGLIDAAAQAPDVPTAVEGTPPKFNAKDVDATHGDVEREA